MKCTSCKNGNLVPAYLEDMLPCHSCDNCGGNWVMLKDYLRWKEQHGEAVAVDAEISAELTDSKKAILCPVTGAVMLKYRISKDHDHRLDLSPSIAGVWLDQGEWLLLKKEGLAGSLNAIFTDSWQRQLRESSAKSTFEALYRQQFGDDYGRIRELRAWIADHPKRADVLSYLMAEDPYSALK